MTKHGDPSRGDHGTIEWEGSADRVALHKPYILLFHSRFIEVRHLDTGRLSQIIPGDDVHCLWDGRNMSNSSVDGAETTEPRVHAAMNSRDRSASRSNAGTVAQRVFELVPTVVLFNPGSLNGPGPADYFPESYSPPRSPS